MVSLVLRARSGRNVVEVPPLHVHTLLVFWVENDNGCLYKLCEWAIQISLSGERVFIRMVERLGDYKVIAL